MVARSCALLQQCSFGATSLANSSARGAPAEFSPLAPASPRLTGSLAISSEPTRLAPRSSQHCSSGVQLAGASSARGVDRNISKERSNFRSRLDRDRGLTPRGVKGWAMGSVSIRATLHLRKALQGLAASGHPFRVSFRATAQARSPCSCRKCVPLAGSNRPDVTSTPPL